MWGSRQAEAFSEICKALNENKIEWLVMRNYEGLPQTNRSKDLDIGVARRDFHRAGRIIDRAVKKTGYGKVFRIRYQYAVCSTYYETEQETNGSVKIDLVDGFCWRGAQIVPFDAVYRKRKPYGDFFVPDETDNAFMLLIKPLMTGGFIKEKYKPEIENELKTNPEGFRQAWMRAFPGRTGAESWEKVMDFEYDALCREKPRLCRRAWTNRFLRHPAETGVKLAEHIARETGRRILRKRPTMIAVVGPDGVGKSTFIEVFVKEFAETTVCNPGDVKVYHFRPNLFPNIKELFFGGKGKETEEEFSRPHRGGKTNPVSSLLRIIYYRLDYAAGYWLKIKPQCRHNGKVIFDRYMSDFLTDPERSRIYLPYGVRKAFVRMTPQPDLTYVLTCDAQIIHERKQELTTEEIQKILDGYAKITDETNQFIQIDASRKPDEMVSDAIRAYIGKLRDL